MFNGFWIEQGGLVSGISVSVYRWGTNTYALTLPTAFASTNYHVSASGNNDYIDAFCYKKETTTATITFKANEYNTYQTTVCSWYACGY